MPGPGEPSNLEVDSVSVVELQSLVVDDVNDGHDKRFRVFLDALQKRTKPVLRKF